MVILVAAAAENNALGKNNKLLWHSPDDFKHFKNLTSGHHIIMGRKTFETFPQPLPNRTHLIVSRQTTYHPDGGIVKHSLEEALDAVPQNEDAFVIGGGEIYKLAMKYADRIELTRVHANFDADAYFPEIDSTQWKITNQKFHPKDDRHAFDFTFVTYEST